MFDTPCLIYDCESYENSKQKELLLAHNFWKGHSFGNSNNSISELIDIDIYY